MEPPGVSFAKHMADMSKSARIALSRSGIPKELINKIMKNTIYGNLSSLAPLVDIEYKSFRKMIDTYHIIHDQVLEIYPELDPSWVIEIIEKFIEFLKTTPPNSVPIFDLLEAIIAKNQYLTQSQVYENERMPRDKYRVWVDRFIQYHYRPDELEKIMHTHGMTDESLSGILVNSRITLDSDIGKGIIRFFDEVVAILSDVFDEMTGYDRHSLAIKCHPDELYTRLFSKQQNREAILKAILIIRTSVIDGMIPIFKSLIKLKTKKKYADLMKFLTFENMLKLDSELEKIKQGRGGGLTRKRRSNKNKHKS